MKVFFLNPAGDYPNGYPPLGLLYLAATCRKFDHEVFFYDLAASNADEEEFRWEFNRVMPDILCVSVYTTGLSKTVALIEKLKRMHSYIRVIIGGPHVSALPGTVIKECTAVDYEVIGEGENTLAELVDKIENDLPVGQVKGIVYRSGKIISRTEKRERIENLDLIHFPAVDLIKRFKYGYDKIAVGKRVGLVITSRGCPYNCTFCHKGTFGNTFTRRSPENVIAEVMYQYYMLEVDEIYFVDDLFITDEEWINSFLDLYSEARIGLPWKCLGRVDQGNEKLYRKMKDTGCFLIQFGVETGNLQIMKKIRKNIKLEQVVDSVNTCKKVGLNSATFFTIGHEGETDNTARETIRFAQKVNSDVCHFFTVSPYPGTYNYNLLNDEEKNQWDRISYYHTKERLPLSVSNITPKNILKYQKNARFEFYGRLGYLSNVLSSRGPAKITAVKAIIFSVSFVVRFWLFITRNRVVKL